MAHPVAHITQPIGYGGFTARRYGSFAGKTTARDEVFYPMRMREGFSTRLQEGNSTKIVEGFDSRLAET